MIIIKDYGVELHQLTENKIELVRKWRNNPKISQYMEFRDEITPQMQKKWFEKISNSDNQFYFIIVYESKDVGLINIKNVDWDSLVGEYGIFIYDDNCLHSGVSYRAVLCQCDFAFDILRLTSLKAYIFNTNIRSIKFNKKIGLQLDSNEDLSLNSEKNQLYNLKKETYKKQKNKIIEMLKSKYSFTPPIKKNEY